MRLAIIDNDLESVNSLTDMFVGMNNLDIVGCFRLSAEAIENIDGVGADALIINIGDDRLDGFALAEAAMDQWEHVLIIFTADSAGDALEAYNTGAVGYLTRPYSPELVAKTIRRLERLTNRTRSPGAARRDVSHSLLDRGFIASTDGSKYFLNSVDDILYFSVDNKRVNLRTTDSTYTVTYSMKELEMLLQGTSFMRCQKSYIVNLRYVESIDIWFNQTYLLNLRGINERIPVSRMFSKKMKKMMFG